MHQGVEGEPSHVFSGVVPELGGHPAMRNLMNDDGKEDRNRPNQNAADDIDGHFNLPFFLNGYFPKTLRENLFLDKPQKSCILKKIRAESYLRDEMTNFLEFDKGCFIEKIAKSLFGMYRYGLYIVSFDDQGNGFIEHIIITFL